MKIRSKVWKTGGSYVITIPKAYVDGGLIPLNKEIEIEVFV